MRIALLCPYDVSMPGGVQGQVLGLAPLLAEGGDEVAVLAPGERPGSLAESVEFVSLGRSLSVPANGSRAPVTLSRPAVRRALAATGRGKADVVHVHEPLLPGPALAVTARSPLPLVGTFHRARAGFVYSTYGMALGRFVRRLDVRVAVSEVAAHTMRAVAGDVAVDVIANAVDVDAVRHVKPVHNRAPTAVFVGRLERRKGVDLLLQAFTGLAGDVELHLIGEGPETRQLRDRFSGDARVKWLGRVSDSERDAELAGADVFVAFARGGESFGVVLLEAMAAGTAVLASDLPGYRMAAGDAARFVPTGNAKALRDALGELLFDRRQREELVALGRARAEQHSFANLTTAYRDRYATAVSLAADKRRSS